MYLHFENTNMRTELMIETEIPRVQRRTYIHTYIRERGTD